MMIGKRLKIKEYKDERGLLMAVNQMPFNARRMFFISNVPEGADRGNHFSKSSDFLYIIIQGGCKVSLDNGICKELHELTVGDALMFSKETWMRIFDFQDDAILCVLADTEYNALDYESDYDEFCRIVRKKDV